MIYFDTDVLIHFLISQDPAKHEKANILYQAAAEKDQFFISLLCLQETAFVLQKLGVSVDNIDEMLTIFFRYRPAGYDITEMKRGIELAKKNRISKY